MTSSESARTRIRLRRSSTMTYEEARTVGRPAYCDPSGEEFMLLPRSGEVLWRALEKGELHDGMHRGQYVTVPQGKAVPQEGWYHDLPCACEFCRRT